MLQVKYHQLPARQLKFPRVGIAMGYTKRVQGAITWIQQQRQLLQPECRPFGRP
jgi:hypothetical protein